MATNLHNITEEILQKNGIRSISIISEASWKPMMRIKYLNGSENKIYDKEIDKFLKELK
jgi:hypothetical protein